MADAAATKRKKKKKKRQQEAMSPLVVPSSGPREKAAKRQRRSEPVEAAEECGGESAVAVLSPTAVRDAVYRSGTSDSEVRARKVLGALVAPVSVGRFYGEYFEKKALVARGRGPEYLAGWASAAHVWEVLEREEMLFGIDVDVTTYDGRRRRTHGTAGSRCEARAARRLFEASGATIRLRTPQERLASVHALCEALEDEFGATTSANAYMTPANSQGFAPHSDDVDVFVLQLSGSKRWRVYEPDEAHALPRASSPDFETAPPWCRQVVDTVLEPGDLLYAPRGFPHEARSLDSTSLHLTLSTHRQNAWADYLECLVGLAMDKLVAAERGMRRALPRDYLHVLGLQHAGNFVDDKPPPPEDDDDDDLAAVTAARLDPNLDRGRRLGASIRARFAAEARSRLERLVAVAIDETLDDAADEMATKFIAERQPPPEQQQQQPRPPISHATLLYPAGRRIARLVVRDDKALLYHSLHNATAHRKNPVALLEFELDDAPAIELLLSAHPARPVAVNQLPLPSLDDKLALADALYQEGLLRVAQRAAAD